MFGKIIFKKPTVEKAVKKTLATFNREEPLNKAVSVVENKDATKRKRNKKDASTD